MQRFVGRLATALSAMTLGVLVAAGSALTAQTAAAETFTQQFDVQCTQGYVNGGQPFAVGVTAEIDLPDTIVVGQEVAASVTLDLLLPPVVADTIAGYGYDTMAGLVDATVQVTEGSNVTDLTAVDSMLPSIAVTAGESISIQTAPSFPIYTTIQEGQALVGFSGDFVTVHDVVVSNDFSEFSLGAFNCSATQDVLVATVSVSPATASPTATTSTASPSTHATTPSSTQSTSSAAAPTATTATPSGASDLADTGSTGLADSALGLGLMAITIGALAIRRQSTHR